MRSAERALGAFLSLFDLLVGEGGPEGPKRPPADLILVLHSLREIFFDAVEYGVGHCSAEVGQYRCMRKYLNKPGPGNLRCPRRRREDAEMGSAENVPCRAHPCVGRTAWQSSSHTWGNGDVPPGRLHAHRFRPSRPLLRALGGGR